VLRARGAPPPLLLVASARRPPASAPLGVAALAADDGVGDGGSAFAEAVRAWGLLDDAVGRSCLLSHSDRAVSYPLRRLLPSGCGVRLGTTGVDDGGGRDP